MEISSVEAVLGAWLVQAPGSLVGGVSGVMPQAVPEESSGLRVARSALVLEGGPGGLRPIGLLGRPGLAWQVPATRARSGGPVVVAADDPDAKALNRGYGWWLASKPGWVNPGWYTAPLRAEVRALTRFAPGAELLLALTRLSWYSEGSCPGGHDSEPGWDDTGVGRPGFPCACLVVAAAAWEAVTSWSSQQAAEALLQAAGSVEVRTAADPVAPGGLVDPGRDELAVGLRVSPDSMRGRIATARRLHQFPAVTALVAEGLVSYVAGKLLVGELRNIGQDTAAVVTQVIADRVRDRHRLGLRPWGWREIADLLRRLLAALPDQVAKRARKSAFDARGVSVSDAGDGMATICATVRDVDAHRIYARLSAVAASLAAEDDPRTRDQQRADVLTDLLLDPPTGCACAGARAGAEAGGDCGARGDCGAATADSGGAGAAAHSDGASPGAPAGPGSAPRGTCPCGGDAGPEGCGSGSGCTGHGDAADDRDRMGPDDTFSDHRTGSKVDGPPAHDVPPPEPPDDAGAPPDPLDDSIEDQWAESRSDWPGPPPPWLPGGWPFGRASGYELNRWSNAPDAAAPEAWPEPPHDHSEGRPDGRLDDTSADGPHHGPPEAAGDPVACCCGCHGAPSPAGTSGLPPGRGLPGGGGVEVNVVLSLDTLLGVAHDPGHIAGMGPVPADVARELAADGRWRAWVTDTVSGVVVATSPGTYRPTAALQRLIRAREPYCRFPGCRRAATHCDLDHTITFPRGPSEAWNLGPLCRRHHNNKTHHNYRLTGPPDPDTAATDTSWTWTTPTGQTSHDHPDPPLR